MPGPCCPHRQRDPQPLVTPPRPPSVLVPGLGHVVHCRPPSRLPAREYQHDFVCQRLRCRMGRQSFIEVMLLVMDPIYAVRGPEVVLVELPLVWLRNPSLDSQPLFDRQMS